ncbi:MAG TPA: hypothetical protein VFQ63_01825, partial [Patescibacteria group bacterium]|nr:hypothetical protein [Patescibacteria group bacterium]
SFKGQLDGSFFLPYTSRMIDASVAYSNLPETGFHVYTTADGTIDIPASEMVHGNEEHIRVNPKLRMDRGKDGKKHPSRYFIAMYHFHNLIFPPSPRDIGSIMRRQDDPYNESTVFVTRGKQPGRLDIIFRTPETQDFTSDQERNAWIEQWNSISTQRIADRLMREAIARRNSHLPIMTASESVQIQADEHYEIVKEMCRERHLRWFRGVDEQSPILSEVVL